MRVDRFDFELPERLIAQTAIEPRDAARLLHVGASLADRGVRDLPGLLNPGDMLVFNNSKVIPARLFASVGEKQIEQIKAARNARALATVEEAVTLKARLEQAPIRLAVKAGKEGRLFGAVKTADVVAAVVEAGIGELDKRKVAFVAPIRTTGTHEATVRLHGDVVATITLAVVAQK
mgnify:CR=1 FL=1